jgi:ATP-dependent Clp protease adaptor protein ClpS
MGRAAQAARPISYRVNRQNSEQPLQQGFGFAIFALLMLIQSHSRTALSATLLRPLSSDDGEGAAGDGGKDGGGQIGVATKTRTRTKKPSQYKVLMLNDDYTPMEFVVLVLKRFFRMDMEQATRVMLHVHQRGVGVCGIFPYEVAETKVNQVMDFARENQHPLQCTLEKA